MIPMNTHSESEDTASDSGNKVLLGRMFEIASGQTDLPLNSVKRYRALWAAQGYQLPSLDDTAILTTRTRRRSPRNGCGNCGRMQQINGHGPGSQLLKMYTDAGVPHCHTCLSLATKMDEWGVQECRNRIEEIVDDILPRAKNWLSSNRPWMHRLLAGVGIEETAIRLRIKQDVLKSINKAASVTPAEIDGLTKGRSGFRPRDWSTAFKPSPQIPQFITNEQFARDTLSLISRLPPNITAVAGVSRSGLHPATMIAMMLHVPLIVVRHHQADWFPAGNGWRLNEGQPKHQGITLVVDDTTMTGNSLQRTKHVIADMPGKKLFAAIYVNPAAKAKPDLWAVDLPWPHLLQWNLFNSVMMDSCAFDFDGVLCHDCPIADDDDGPRYEAFLKNAIPRHLVRKRQIKLIVTARLEKYRQLTNDWLDVWGISVDRLVMGPWETLQDRRKDDVPAFKARELESWFAADAPIRPKIFLESCPQQAQQIAKISGGLVACPNGQCFRGGN